MCGIVGYIGSRQALPVLLDGLRRLEYRGYDSAGVAILDGGEIAVRRSVGKIAGLEAAIGPAGIPGTLGIGHTRWATHGRPSELNAHPHRSGPFVVVHNGIIENHLALKKRLQGRGYAFSSETDTEVVAVLLHSLYRGDARRALARTLAEIEGSYALAILCVDEPGCLFAARGGSPLVIGSSAGEQFLASDVPALIAHTREVIYLENGETAVLRREGIALADARGRARRAKTCHVPWDPVSAERGGFKHFMLKEIHEQPTACLDTFRTRVSQEKGRVLLDEEAGLTPKALAGIRRVRFLACGTSWHAGLVGEHMIERLAGLPAEVDLASEFRYRGAPAEEGVLTVAISQSGETKDTIEAFREARSKGGFRLAVCNVLGSSITREIADGVLYTHAGPEISVASTKAFTSQLTALYLLALFLGQQRGRLSRGALTQHLADLVRLPALIGRALALDGAMAELGQRFAKSRDCLFLGRGVNYPVALEGALKLKEISYVHAEGYAGGEMKHGPIALIDSELPVFVLVPRDENFAKMFSNLEEVKSRHGIVIAFTDRAGKDLADKADRLFTVPRTNPFLTPILLTLPLQLFAYHVADARGHDVDQPRNLAKSVTVE